MKVNGQSERIVLVAVLGTLVSGTLSWLSGSRLPFGLWFLACIVMLSGGMLPQGIGEFRRAVRERRWWSAAIQGAVSLAWLLLAVMLTYAVVTGLLLPRPDGPSRAG